MKKKYNVVLIYLLILILAYIGIHYFFLRPCLVETKIDLMAITEFQKVGFDHDDKKLKSSLMFPWQDTHTQNVWEEPDVWGKKCYLMPDIHLAVDSFGLPQPVVDENKAIKPLYYASARFQETNSKTVKYYHYYIVIDENGYLWLDEDGRFNDSRLKKSMTHDSIVVGSDKVDETDVNNTIGPFLLKELEVIKDDVIYTQGNDCLLPLDQEWFVLEYFTIDNDVLGIIDTNKITELNSFINEALDRNIDYNMVLYLQICKYNIQPRYVLLK